MKEAKWDQIEAAARDIGRFIGKLIPSGFGYTLAVYRFGAGGEMTYVSNGRREDVVKMLRELAEVLEHKAEAPHGAAGHPAREMGPKS